MQILASCTTPCFGDQIRFGRFVEVTLYIHTDYVHCIRCTTLVARAGPRLDCVLFMATRYHSLSLTGQPRGRFPRNYDNAR